MFNIINYTIMDNQVKSVDRVIDNYYQEILNYGYADLTIKRFHDYAERFRKWCADHHVSAFCEDVAIQFCTEELGSYVFSSNLTNTQKDILRVIRMIVGFDKNGVFEIRGPRREYKFSGIKDVVTGHIARYVDKKHPSLDTLQSRKRVLENFGMFLEAKDIRLNDLTPDLFEEFFSQSIIKSRKEYKTHIREFYRDLHDANVINDDLSKYIQKEPHICKPIALPTTYTKDEIKRIIASVDRSSVNGKRAYLVILLAAEYGLRSSDIINLRFGNIDWENNMVNIIQEKTHEHVQFPLLSSVGNAIIDYVKNGRPTTDSDVIIVRHDSTFKGKSVSKTLVYKIVSEAIAQAEINDWRSKRHGPHSLRHSLASNMLKQGTALSVISNVLGHKSTETTKVYISVDIDKLRLCGLQIPPVASNQFRKEGRI